MIEGAVLLINYVKKLYHVPLLIFLFLLQQLTLTRYEGIKVIDVINTLQICVALLHKHCHEDDQKYMFSNLKSNTIHDVRTGLHLIVCSSTTAHCNMKTEKKADKLSLRKKKNGLGRYIAIFTDTCTVSLIIALCKVYLYHLSFFAFISQCNLFR